MNTYAIYDGQTGDVLHICVCQGPFELPEAMIESMLDAGTLADARFRRIDPDHGVPRTIFPAQPAAEPQPMAQSRPLDWEMVA